MSFKGTGLWRTLSELTKSNRDEWFKAIERIAEGEEMPLVNTNTLDKYSVIKETDRTKEPEDQWVEFYVPSSSRAREHKFWRDTSRDKEYRKAAASFLLNFEGKINSKDRERIEEITDIPAKIKKLRDKYYNVTYQSSSKLVKAFTSWEMDQKLCPSDNFVAIYAVRKEAHRHSAETRFTDDYMWNTFIDGLLPKGAYDSITDGFPNSQLSEDEKLQKLDEKWEKLTAKKEKSFIADSANYNDRSDYQSFLQAEASFIAYGQKHGFLRSRSKDSSRSMESGGSTRSDGCFKCGSSKHRGIACPFAERAFEYAKKLRVKQDGEESDEDQRTYQPIKVRGSSPHQEHYWRSSSPRPLSSCGRN